MVGTTAQLVALTCHFNACARGLATGAFFPGNSTCQFCEFVRFVRPRSGGIAGPVAWDVVAATPDDWLATEAVPGASAAIVHQTVNDPRIPDRMSAGFVGGGGRWMLVTGSRGHATAWQAGWQAGDRDAPEQRIWRVNYGLVGEGVDFPLPASRPLDALKADLRNALGDILAFAERNRIEGFSDCFRKGIACLSSDAPLDSPFHRDLAPAGVLDLAAKQVLAACQAAWVFGGMGSWNDMIFDGPDQAGYESTSERLFSLLNEGICASANSSAGLGK